MPNNPLKSMWDTHQKTLILSLIFFVALLLRLFGLSQESLWNDELATWLFTRRSSLLEVIKMAGLDRSPPLYQLLISIHTSMFGDSEWSLRFPSVVFSLLSMGALYVWVKEFYQEKVALLAVGLMAIMYVPIYFAQEARNYSLLILLSILSFHASALILKEISDRQTQIFNWRPYLFLSLTSLALCYTHYFGLLLVLVQGLVLIAISAIYRNPFHLTKLIIGYGLVGLLYLPWFSYIYPEAISNMDFWIPKPNRYSFWEVFQYFFNDSIILSVVAFFTCLFFVGIRVFDSVKQKKMNFSLPSLFQILVVSLVTIIAFVKSRYSTSVFLPKYFVIFAPLAYLLFARALLNLSSSKLILRMAIGGVFYIFLAHLFFVIHYYDRDDKKEQFDEAFKIIASYGKMAQDWPMVSLVWRPEYLDYYLIRNKIMLKKGLNLQGDADDIQRVRQFVGNPWVNPTKKLNFDHFWFFSGHRIPDPQLLMMMGELYTPVKYSTLKGVQLILFKSKENAARAKQLGLAPAKDTEFQKIRSDTGVVDLTEMFSGR